MCIRDRSNIAARVRSVWRYSAPEDEWMAEVYVTQDREGKVLSVNVRNSNVGNSNKAAAFMNSIERAVYKASPLPAAPDEAIFDPEIYFIFVAN